MVIRKRFTSLDRRCWDKEAALLRLLRLEAADSVRSWKWGMDAHPWYFIWPLSYLFARWRPESTASIKWPITFPAAHPSTRPPLCVLFFQVLYFFVYSWLFSIICACPFSCHSLQAAAVETVIDLVLKVCMKPQKRGVAVIMGFFHDNWLSFITASFQRMHLAFVDSHIFLYNSR